MTCEGQTWEHAGWQHVRLNFGRVTKAVAQQIPAPLLAHRPRLVREQAKRKTITLARRFTKPRPQRCRATKGERGAAKKQAAVPQGTMLDHNAYQSARSWFLRNDTQQAVNQPQAYTHNRSHPYSWMLEVLRCSQQLGFIHNHDQFTECFVAQHTGTLQNTAQRKKDGDPASR